MGKIDTEAKEYLSNVERFSDLFNYWIYNGEKVIHPENLHELDTTAIAIPYGNKSKKHVQKYRDLLNLYTAMEDDQAVYLIFGLEIESKIHYAMPVRNMLYDALSYAHQVDIIVNHNRKEKNIQNSNEFLSGMKRDDRLHPVVTLVVNISGKHWDGSDSIHSLLSVGDERILKYVPDYRINLLSPDTLAEDDFDKFHTGVGAALQFIKHQHDDNMDWIINQKRLERVDRATAEFIQTATGTSFEIDDEEEEINMCRAWENSMEQAKSEGKAEGILAGREEGQRDAKLTSIRNLMKNKGWTVQEAMDALMISTEEQAEYISMI